MVNYQIQLGDITVNVTLKKMKNIRLRIYPNGAVKLSAPLRTSQKVLHTFLHSKLEWIQQVHTKYCVAHSHNYYIWGIRYTLKITDSSLFFNHTEKIIFARSEAIIEDWYREELKKALPPILEKWQKIINVQMNKFFVQKMKTRWGSCNYTSKNVRFNSELVKKSPECLEYVVVHELVHLLEPSHNKRFHSLMNEFLPNWKRIKIELNRIKI